MNKWERSSGFLFLCFPLPSAVTTLLLFLLQKSINTVNIVSNPHLPPLFTPIPNISMLTAKIPQMLFHCRSPPTRQSIWTSVWIPAQSMFSKQVHAFAMGLWGPILYTASAFYTMLLQVGHFTPPPPTPRISYLGLVIHHCFDIWHHNQSRTSLTEAARQAHLCSPAALSPHHVSQQKVHCCPRDKVLLLLRGWVPIRIALVAKPVQEVCLSSSPHRQVLHPIQVG